MADVIMNPNIQRLLRAKDNELGQPISHYYDCNAIVVLGDPGLGKTTCFKSSAVEEPNAEYLTVRKFVNLPITELNGKTLYLDGLDEQRSNSAGSDIVGALAGRLKELGSPKFRIACRAADWYGSSDESLLQSVASGGRIQVLILEPLSDDQIRVMASRYTDEPSKFLHEARSRGLYPLLTNPQTLILLAETVGSGRWPSTKKELLEQACKSLLREKNETHALKEKRYNEVELYSAAGFLCAIQILANTVGFSIDSNETDILSFPSLDTLERERPILEAAARRRVFKWQGTTRFEPIHRMVAEFLAASYLASCLESGLALGRVLGHITTVDGGTIAPLRGVLAWLVSLCPKYAETFIAKDPLGIVSYGDVSGFSTSNKVTLFKEIEKLAAISGWFRNNQWNSKPFGALSDASMTTYFRTILKDRAKYPVFISCVLDSISEGYADPPLCPELLATLRDNSMYDFVREKAYEALVATDPQDCVLLQLLDELNSGDLADPDGALRCEMLRHLYPSTLNANQVIKYVIDNPSTTIGKYFTFVTRELLDRTTGDQISVLIEAYLCNPPPSKKGGSELEPFRGRLLVRALAEAGDQVPVETLDRWLDIGIEKYGQTILRHEELAKVSEWFEARPELVQKLFMHVLEKTETDKIRSEFSFNFIHRISSSKLPPFAQLLLKLAVDELDDNRANALFQEVLALSWEDRPTNDELKTFMHRNTRFSHFLETFLKPSPIPQWQMDQDARVLEADRLRKERHAFRVSKFSGELESIGKGTNIPFLVELGSIALSDLLDSTTECNPFQRLITETNEEIAAPAVEGLINALPALPPLLPIVKVAEMSCRHERSRTGYALIAGMDFLWERSTSEFEKLPDAVLKTGLVFIETYFGNPQEDRPWVKYLFEGRADLCASAFQEFWSAEIEHGAAVLTKGYKFLIAENTSRITNRVVIALLAKYPFCGIDILKELLISAIHYSNQDDFLPLCRKALSLTGLQRNIGRADWDRAGPALPNTPRSHQAHRHLVNETRICGNRS